MPTSRTYVSFSPRVDLNAGFFFSLSLFLSLLPTSTARKTEARILRIPALLLAISGHPLRSKRDSRGCCTQSFNGGRNVARFYNRFGFSFAESRVAIDSRAISRADFNAIATLIRCQRDITYETTARWTRTRLTQCVAECDKPTSAYISLPHSLTLSEYSRGKGRYDHE